MSRVFYPIMFLPLMTDSGGAVGSRRLACREVEPSTGDDACIGFGEGRRIPAMARRRHLQGHRPKVGRVELKRDGKIETVAPILWRLSNPARP
jgi:N-methylhydantoinase B